MNSKNINKSNDKKTNNINSSNYEFFEKLISHSNLNHEKTQKMIDSSLENQQLIDEVIIYSKKEIIKKIDENISKLNSSIKGYIDTAIDELNYSVKGHMDKNFNDLNLNIDTISHSLNKVNDIDESINKFINSQKDVNKDLLNAVFLFTNYYDECKKYFFNNNEKILNKYLDTDDLFRLCFFNNIQFLSYSHLENKLLLQTKDNIILATNNRFYTIKEVIGFNGYSIPNLFQFEKFVVFDIGMNRGYASLWFAKFENCIAVYGFEIDNETFNKAKYNFSLNKSISSKIFPYNFGLSDKNEIVDLYYLTGQDGLNTIISEFTEIQPEFKNNKDKIQVKKVEIKKTSEIVQNIIKTNNINSKIILKIDTEGSEYNIINDLIISGLINDIDIILGESHIFSDESISDKLLKHSFKQINLDKHEFTYNFAFVKEIYCDIWPLKEF